METTWRQVALACALSASLLSSACDWVDSAGSSSSSNDDGSVMTQTQITLNEQPLGAAVSLLEMSSSRVVVAERADDDTIAYRFDDEPLEQGALDSCLALDGFDADRAADTLAAACSSEEDNCQVIVLDDSSNADELAFTLDVPQLRAPVGQRRALSIGNQQVDENGELVFVENLRQEIEFCLISINEAPDVANETYVLVEGGVLDVDAADGLLSNDSDDDDAGNQPLRIDPTPVSEPMSADLFELREDGGFTYRFAVEGIREDVLDRFSYRVTDGSSSSIGEATVRVVAANQAPVVVATPDTVFARVDELLEEDLSVFFEDPEGLSLSFEFAEDLPSDGDLELTADGVLQGTPGEDDEGEYSLTLIADDGERTTELPITLVIEASLNQPPVFVAGSVFDQTVLLGNRIETVAPEFEDPDGDELTYSSVGADLPQGVNLNATNGRVNGRPRASGQVTGIVIQAEDSAGNTAESDPFSIRTL